MKGRRSKSKDRDVPGCTGKIRYSEKHAKMEAGRMKEFKGQDVTVYKCDACDNYHITSMTPAQYQRWIIGLQETQ